MFKFLDKLESIKDYAPIIFRLVFLYYLITSLLGGIYTPSYAEKFSENLAGLGFPFPLFFSYLGIWSVLIGYAFVVIGYEVRLAALPLIIYFGVALITYHIPEGHGVRQSFSAIMLMLLGFFFLINGAGKFSIDEGV